jgi:DNA-binding NarL/FixJ family response regulator
MPLLDRIRILIVHDDPIIEAGLSSGLGRYADFDAREHNSAQNVPALPAHSSPDVVVADYEHGMRLAIDARRSLAQGKTSRVVIVGGVDREWEIKSALGRGVRGYLLVGCGIDELANAVRAVHRGMRYLSPSVAERLAESLSLEALTMREEDVLCLVVEGLGNKAISRRLGIAIGTVKSHLKATFDKLNVDSRTQAVAVVERRGLLRHHRPRCTPSAASDGGMTASRRFAAPPEMAYSSSRSREMSAT